MTERFTYIDGVTQCIHAMCPICKEGDKPSPDANGWWFHHTIDEGCNTATPCPATRLQDILSSEYAQRSEEKEVIEQPQRLQRLHARFTELAEAWAEQFDLRQPKRKAVRLSVPGPERYNLGIQIKGDRAVFYLSRQGTSTYQRLSTVELPLLATLIEREVFIRLYRKLEQRFDERYLDTIERGLDRLFVPEAP